MNAKGKAKRTLTVGFALFISMLVVCAVVAVLLQSGRTQRPSGDSVPFAESPPEASHAQGKYPNGSLCEGNAVVDKEKLKENIFHMEQYGGEGAVAILVKDTSGKPIEGASVRLGFTQPDQCVHTGIVEGKTDKNGFFSAKETSNWACIWTVAKEGYHVSRGRVLFTHKGSQKAFLEGRWTDEPIDIEVELKDISGAKFVHGRRYADIVYFPTNSWVGFDFFACDLVKPYGSGKTSHVLFRSESDGVSPFCKGATPGYTNVLQIKVSDGGLSIAAEADESESPFMSHVPLSFGTNILTFVHARTKDTILEDKRLAEKYYIIFSSQISNEEKSEPYCGILRNLEFFPGQLRLEYFFNTIPGDQRLDADVSSPLNLGK